MSTIDCFRLPRAAACTSFFIIFFFFLSLSRIFFDYFLSLSSISVQLGSVHLLPKQIIIEKHTHTHTHCRPAPVVILLNLSSLKSARSEVITNIAHWAAAAAHCCCCCCCCPAWLISTSVDIIKTFIYIYTQTHADTDTESNADAFVCVSNVAKC